MKAAAAKNETQIGREYWLVAAREAIIQGGVENVKIDRLARLLNVTRGGFYWHFKNREDLLDALLADWEQTNTKPLFDAAEAAKDGDGASKFVAVSLVWIEEKGFSPAYDAAIRDWGRISKRVVDVVRRVDNRRVKLLQTIFQDMGYEEAEAQTRAQIMYYHQVGYYAMGVRQSRTTRLSNIPLYFHALTGRDMPDPEKKAGATAPARKRYDDKADR